MDDPASPQSQASTSRTQTVAGSDSSADEVLSQLAGDEIDRMLADAEDGVSAPPAVADIPKQNDPPQPASREKTIDRADPEINRQLDDLFNALTASSPNQPAPPTPPAPQPATPDSAASVPPDAEPVEPPSLEQQVIAAASLRSIPETEAVVAKSKEQNELGGGMPNATAAGQSGRATVSWPLRPLRWVSGRFSENSLDWMGKIAILTTANALLILAYVLLSRR
jgi:hypothetical protein